MFVDVAEHLRGHVRVTHISTGIINLQDRDAYGSDQDVCNFTYELIKRKYVHMYLISKSL